MSDVINTKVMRHSVRADTDTAWQSVNPVLYRGEFGLAYNESKQDLKLGDGSTAWNDLPSFLSNVDSIKDSNNSQSYKIWVGTAEEYVGIGTKDEYTLYFVTEKGDSNGI